MWNFFRRRRKSTGSKLPEFLPILQEMARAWEALPAEEIDRYAALHLKPAGPEDTKLGVVHSQEARRTWALANHMKMRWAEAKLNAQSKAESEEEARFYQEQADRFDVLEDCLRELFWAQAKDDIGGKAWEAKAVGIRAGWMFVSTRQQTPNIMEFLGGGFTPRGD
jgi:hypothetical protein